MCIGAAAVKVIDIDGLTKTFGDRLLIDKPVLQHSSRGCRRDRGSQRHRKVHAVQVSTTMRQNGLLPPVALEASQLISFVLKTHVSTAAPARSDSPLADILGMSSAQDDHGPRGARLWINQDRRDR